MPVATIKFKLPEENGEYRISLKAGELYCAIEAIRRTIRSHHKYDMPLREAFEEICEIINELDVIDG